MNDDTLYVVPMANDDGVWRLMLLKAKGAHDGGMVEFIDPLTGECSGSCGIHFWQEMAQPADGYDARLVDQGKLAEHTAKSILIPDGVVGKALRRARAQRIGDAPTDPQFLITPAQGDGHIFIDSLFPRVRREDVHYEPWALGLPDPRFDETMLGKMLRDQRLGLIE